MINTIRLNHTVWYNYAKKIIRINISDMLPIPISLYSYTLSGQIEYPGLVKVHSVDKTYYSKEEVDNLIKKLKEELTAEDHDTHSAEEHPQQ